MLVLLYHGLVAGDKETLFKRWSLSEERPAVSNANLKYQQVMREVENAIEREEYGSGDRLPSLRDLAVRLGCNVLTVRKGLQRLEERGVVEARRGSGTFVRGNPVVKKAKITRVCVAFRKNMIELSKDHPAIAAFLAGAQERLDCRKYSLLSLFYRGDSFLEDIGEALLDQGIDGVIIPSGGMRERDFAFLRDNKIPVVHSSLGRQDDELTTMIVLDWAAALHEVIAHLRGLGHRRIAFISWDRMRDARANDEFAKLAFEHQLGDSRELLVRITNDDKGMNWADSEKFFDIDPLPTAAITFDEFIANLLLASCDRRGIKVPDDLSVAAVSDLMPYNHRIPVTAAFGVEDHSKLMYRACDMLLRMIKGEHVQRESIGPKARVVMKASTATPGVQTIQR